MPDVLRNGESAKREAAIYDMLIGLGLNVHDHLRRLRGYNKTQPYHNYQHMYQVTLFAAEGADYYGLDQTEKKHLILAALYHDLNHSGDAAVSDAENIHVACSMVEAILPGLEKDIDASYVASLIRATQFPPVSEKTTITEQIICDSDILQNIAPDREEWFKGLSKETGREVTYESTREWLAGNLDTLFHTDWAKEKVRTSFNL
jgi:5'-deoxynucleotidase YfbR-like HD superfamily hydrolase